MKKAALHFSVSWIVLFLTACTAAAQISPTATQIPSILTTESTATHLPNVSTLAPFPTNVRLEDDTEYRIPSMMGFDAIAPIYNPRFASVDEASMEDTELVMGVAIDGQAKAYPVNVLRFREMVNDEIAGWPVLVTW